MSSSSLGGSREYPGGLFSSRGAPVNFWQAAQLELFNDEAYYWMCSRFPDWGYFDHPPMVAWWVILGSWAGRRTRGPARERDLLDPGRMAVCPACPTSACHGCGALVRAALP